MSRTNNSKYDAGDQGDVQRRKTKAEIEQDRQEMELRALLETHGGRYFIWKILKKCRVFHTVSNTDPISMALSSGGRDVGLSVLAEVMAIVDEDYFSKMQREAILREEDE